MTSYHGRDFLLKIGNGDDPENYQTLGAARTNNMSINNNLVDATTMGDAGIQNMMADAGVQSMQVSIEGLFKDSIAEEILRQTAMDRQKRNFELHFANGDIYQASFVIQDYSRTGTYDDLESFSASLIRSGDGVLTVPAS